MQKHYISPEQLLEDAYQLAWQVFESGYRPTCIAGIWRGGTPVAIAVQELLLVMGVNSDHTAIRTNSYTGIGARGPGVQVDGLEYLVARLGPDDRLLLVDDVHDTGLSLQAAISALESAFGERCPEIRGAVAYFKPGNNRCAAPPDYCVHQTDDWLVFPHEIDGLTREEIRDNKRALQPLLEQIGPYLPQG